ncbi:MAG: alpha-1,4-glucan--maltose-1-phosphate maltosyltransferase [Acidimicrobiaceae bacterium]|nr:alpha-1,4-glucan--maltose-1-phosphate maltosyltransferase [Acidimicrobiaceae bacterium]
MTGRLVIEDIHPRTPGAEHPAKAVVGEALTVRAAIFKEGHDALAARVLLFPAGSGEAEQVAPLREEGNDDWSGVLVPQRVGRYQFVVQAWTHRHATWAHKVEAKLEAGQEIDVELAEGELLLAAAEPLGDGRLPPVVANALSRLRDRSLVDKERVADALSPPVAAAMWGPYGAVDFTTAAALPLRVDRERAAVGAWYELFPRSHGGFRATEARIPALAAMGFDVVYLPPIHPIGRSHRKGPNNTLNAGPGDPGSPWAIGSSDGGHTTVHPDLGTLEDFDHLVSVVREAGMEVALDYALQCSPDHPWVSAHPEWFHHRPDGSIAYAENPPKKYQDIVPINFWPASDADRVSLWQACKDILDFWIGHGIEIFRVDNPHTKPIAFWEWLIPAVQAENPGVVFLAEAFTRPHMMAKLAAVGFSQSYTYFTWRTERDGPEGLWAYLDELAHGPAADYLRPAFWPNTPDILSGPLRNGPLEAFALRLVLAATASPIYGIYSGYELGENRPASPTNEEYLDSEKYQIIVRDYSQPNTLVPLITELNGIRRRHPALRTMRSLVLHPTDNPMLIAYSKRSDDGTDVVLTVVNLDPYDAQEGWVTLRLDTLGVDAVRPFQVFDELSGSTWSWQGERGFVRLDPARQAAHLFVVRQP